MNIVQNKEGGYLAMPQAISDLAPEMSCHIFYTLARENLGSIEQSLGGVTEVKWTVMVGVKPFLPINSVYEYNFIRILNFILQKLTT